MKRKIIILLSGVVLSLTIIPATNIFNAKHSEVVKFDDISFLYNMDIEAGWLAKCLYFFGVSTIPKKVIVGRDGWLYLGDEYNKTISVGRYPLTKTDIALDQKIDSAVEAWDKYFAAKGVKLFRIMIAPNKSTIYPEYMPAWAKPVSPIAVDNLLSGRVASNYVDFRAPLAAVKANYPQAFYYKTDTHWNHLGAGLAFQYFSQQVRDAAPEILWPPDSANSISRVVSRKGGDLAAMLRISNSFSDPDPITQVLDTPLETIEYYFDTGEIIRQGNNTDVGATYKPILVKSKGALNKKKILWLRDSFGDAMSLLMSKTFSEVLQVHWEEGIRPGGRLVQLVDDWKPDYIFFTVIERAFRSESLATLPPPIFLKDVNNFKTVRTTTPILTNDLIEGNSRGKYQVHGSNPFIDFALSDTVSTSDTGVLSIDLICDDGAQYVPLQLFWLVDGTPYFDEQHSIRFSFYTGKNLIDLRAIPKWGSGTAISRIRLDINSKKFCPSFRLSNPILGLSNARF